MKIFIATVADESWSREMVDHFRALAAADRFHVHSLAENAENADVILFVDLHQFPFDWQLKELRRHPLCHRFERKIMVYDERDRPFCVFPGLYVSMTKHRFDDSRQRACSFCRLKNELMEPLEGEPDLLFSFQGANSHAARNSILELNHPRAVIEDTTKLNFFDFSAYADTDEYKNRVRAQKERYREIVARSKFVLCPRGMGTSSFRLFEILAAGRVPVIVSDEWVAPRGPDWDACSIRVQESEVPTLPHLLEARESQWQGMAQNAEQTFREWFAFDALFHRMGDDCHDLLQQGKLGQQQFPLMDSAFRSTGWEFYKGRLRSQLGLARRALRAKLKR